MSGETSKAGWFLRILAPPLVLLGGVAGFVALAASKETPKPIDVESTPPLVETMNISRMNGVVDIESDGVVVPYRSISIAAQVAGRAIERSAECRAGRMVSEGDLLLRIDPASFELEVERLERERDQAEASLDELTVQIENSANSIAVAEDEVRLREADVTRIETLRKRGVSTQQALDEARIAALTSRKALVTLQNEKRLFEAQRARLEQAIKLATVQLADAELNLERTVIRAPGKGVIVSADVEEGGYLAIGDIVAEFDDTSAVEVKVNLEMRTLAWLRANAPEGTETPRGSYELPRVPVTVLFDVLGNVYSWSGMLDRVDGVGVDPQTRTIPCRVLVENPRSVSMRSGSSRLPVAGPPALVRGMYVKVLLHSTPIEPLLSIPSRAVRPDDSVWAVRDGVLKKFPLLGSRVINGKVLVAPSVTGLRPDEAVVISPVPMAREGMEIRVQESAVAVDDSIHQTNRMTSTISRDGQGSETPANSIGDFNQGDPPQ